MELEQLNIFRISQDLAETLWDIVYKWNQFERITVGTQLIRAVDSISANIAEGFGRFSFKENKQFCYYSRGSLFETKVWIEKAYKRKLLKEQDYNTFVITLKELGIKLNNYINTLGKNN